MARLSVTVSDSVGNVKDELRRKQEESYSIWESVKDAASLIRDHLTHHHRLMSDVRTLLKTMAKVSPPGYSLKGVNLIKTKKRENLKSFF